MLQRFYFFVVTRYTSPGPLSGLLRVTARYHQNLISPTLFGLKGEILKAGVECERLENLMASHISTIFVPYIAVWIAVYIGPSQMYSSGAHCRTLYKGVT